MRRLNWIWSAGFVGVFLVAATPLGPRHARANDSYGTTPLLTSSSALPGQKAAAKTKRAKKKVEKEDAENERCVTFEKSELGKVPKGWTVDKTGRGEGSEWSIVADPTSPSKTGYVLARLAKSPGRVFNLCILDDWSQRDVEIEVRFKAVKGKIDQGGGIVWRYQDANNYYIARMNPLEDNLRFYKVVKGKRTQLATQEGIKIPVGKWQTLAVDCIGNKITCELNGKKVFTKTDDTFEKAGKIGLWTKADARTRFDNFEFE